MYQLVIAPHCYPALYQWRLDFSLTHYHERGFTGATFRTTNDGQTTRGILTLDYTPATLEDVAGHFKAWARPAAYITATRHKTEIGRWAWDNLGQRR